MRTIKFRGKEIETNQWVYGDLLQCPNKYPTIRMWEEAYPIARSIDFVVFPDTIGQFTGLHDKNGREIYEGDIIKFLFHGLLYRGTIIYKDAKFVMNKIYGDGDMVPQDYGEKYIEVIGNIHDDKSLII